MTEPLPVSDPTRDPDYDELWDLVAKLSAHTDGIPATFSERDRQVLTLVDHSARETVTA